MIHKYKFENTNFEDLAKDYIGENIIIRGEQ